MPGWTSLAGQVSPQGQTNGNSGGTSNPVGTSVYSPIASVIYSNAARPIIILGYAEAQFLKALKEKKWMGLDNTRPLMPPMSMMPATKMTDDEMKAIFAYLKTTPPIKNVQPAAVLLPPPAKQ